MYTDEMAKRMQDRVGELYQPANGTEGEMFMSRFCHRCIHDNLDMETFEGGCDILLRTMAFGTDDEDYPREWVIATDGQPKCTAFELDTADA